MTNKEYWKKRAEERKNNVTKQADEAAREAKEAYERARHQINKEVAYWIQQFADAEGISYEEARKMLEAGELEAFRMTLDEYIARGEKLGVDPSWEEAMIKASALHHIDRLNALKAIIRAELEENKARLKGTEWMHQIADYSFQQTLFTIETEHEVAIGFRQPDLDTLHKQIEEAWAPDGLNFVEREGVNNDKLAAEVDRLLTQACITGESYDELTKQLTEQFALKEYEAERIIRTEATQISTRAEMAAYKAAGIEEYEILVTLDERTCRICGPMDGHVELVENMEPGVTAPPLHPNCRCTTIGHYEDDLIDETRIARDEDGNPIHVDGDMTWNEWQKQFKNREYSNARSIKARSIKTEKDLLEVSNSSIINMSNHDEITDYFRDKHGIEITGFDKKDLFDTKATLAGIDDVINRFPGCLIKSVSYNPRLKHYGRIDEHGNIEIGPKGLRSYGTGVHEAAHGLDNAQSISESVIKEACRNLGLRRGTRAYDKAAFELTGDLKDARDPKELFAYAIETEMGKGFSNELSLEIFKLLGD